MPEPQLWLMLVNSVSGANKTARMRIWRALRASGAAALRDGVYLLPKSESARAVFAEQAEEVVAAGGMAHIVAFDGEDDAQHREFVRLFNRSTDYAALRKARCLQDRDRKTRRSRSASPSGGTASRHRSPRRHRFLPRRFAASGRERAGRCRGGSQRTFFAR